MKEKSATVHENGEAETGEGYLQRAIRATLTTWLVLTMVMMAAFGLSETLRLAGVEPGANLLNYFGVFYEINPWMHQEIRPDFELAVEQWHNLQQAGAKVEIIEPVKELPDMVFVANAGLVDGQRLLLRGKVIYCPLRAALRRLAASFLLRLTLGFS